jgi:hypothetical protein
VEGAPDGARYRALLYDTSGRLVTVSGAADSHYSASIPDTVIAGPGNVSVLVADASIEPVMDEFGRLIDVADDRADRFTAQLSVHVRSADDVVPAAAGGESVADRLDVTRTIEVGQGTTLVEGVVGLGYQAFRLDLEQSANLGVQVVPDEVFLTTERNWGDSVLTLCDQHGYFVAQDDDSGEGRASAITQVPVQPGSYYAIVTACPVFPSFDEQRRLIGIRTIAAGSFSYELSITTN